MLKLPITYDDFNDVTHTEDFYFNLSAVELIDLQDSFGEDLEKLIQTMVEKKNIVGMMSAFRKIVQMAYGVRSEDGKRFIKSEELWGEFSQSNAFNKLFWELITDAEKNAEFIVGILPGDFDEKMARLTAAQEAVKTQTINLDRPGGRAIAEGLLEKEEPSKKLEEYTKEELLNLSSDEFDRLVSRHKGNIPKHVLVVAMTRRTSDGKE